MYLLPYLIEFRKRFATTVNAFAGCKRKDGIDATRVVASALDEREWQQFHLRRVIVDNMARLRENLSFRVFHHQSPRVLPYFQRAIRAFIYDGFWCLGNLPILLCGCNAAIHQFGDKGRRKHHVIFVLISRFYGRGKHGNAQRSRTYQTHLHFQVGIVLVGCIGEIEHLHTHRPIAVGVERLSW